MGQLEKYGLYVLCLLIFLIFGVTLWGAPEVNAVRKDANGKDAAAQLAVGGPGTGTASKPQQGVPGTLPQGIVMKDLLGLETPPKVGDDPKKQGEPKGGEPQKKADPQKAPDAPNPGSNGAAKPGPVAPVQRQTHRVGAGDSYTSIAIQYFQDATLAGEIARLNPGLDPRRLQLKTEVVLPTKDEIAALSAAKNAKKAAKADEPKGGEAKDGPVAVAGEEYEVRNGDTMEGISIRVYGNRNRVEDIKKLNPGVTPTNMRVGARLKLPKK